MIQLYGNLIFKASIQYTQMKQVKYSFHFFLLEIKYNTQKKKT